MKKTYRLQVNPYMIYEDKTFKKVMKFRDITPVNSICDYINAVLDADDLIVTNSELLHNKISDRCKITSRFEDFFGAYQVPIKVVKPRQKRPILKDGYVLWFGKHRGQKWEDVPADYKEWFVNNIPEKDWKERKKKYKFNLVKSK